MVEIGLSSVLRFNTFLQEIYLQFPLNISENGNVLNVVKKYNKIVVFLRDLFYEILKLNTLRLSKKLPSPA